MLPSEPQQALPTTLSHLINSTKCNCQWTKLPNTGDGTEQCSATAATTAPILSQHQCGQQQQAGGNICKLDLIINAMIASKVQNTGDGTDS
jgi:hypothetical protein